MKTINPQRAVIVDLDWLEGEIKAIKTALSTGFNAELEGQEYAFNKVLENSTPLSKVCEEAYNQGAINQETTFNDITNRRYDKLKRDFLNSKIELK
ncbi:hypothetical protein ABDK00_014110 [Niabella insulamsoli]|uniref:hypothetical protein n=1 Tax=Niabella insulamsoli TaxID=3144874 RepID=UPI0031FBBCF6